MLIAAQQELRPPELIPFALFVSFLFDLFFTTKITKDTKKEFSGVAEFREGEAPAEPLGLVIVNGE
ncbi:MAG: hypothetical protein ACK50J_04465 [Planctomyces sp.]|jgi:hypothetical protein